MTGDVVVKLVATLSSHQYDKNPSAMNILSVIVLVVILLKCVIASADYWGEKFRRAVDERNFVLLDASKGVWTERDDLLDYVIEKGLDVTVWVINNAEGAKEHVLAALFDKREGMVDGVLGGIKYDDNDLWGLTKYRKELAGSPAKFFRVLDKIKDPKWQEVAVSRGVTNLFIAGKHDLVVPLIDAFGARTFNGKSLKETAIEEAFWSGNIWGNLDIVKDYYDHSAITSEKYGEKLFWSWNNGEPDQAFQFLLEQADQGDLMQAKKRYADKYLEFIQAIAEAPKPIPPAGSRHHRPIERVQRVLDVLAPIINISPEYGPSSIVMEYLLDEDRAKEVMKSKKQAKSTTCIIL